MAYQHQYLDGTKIHFPLGKVVCIGRNYAEHAKELNNPVPTEPLLFIKPASCVVPVAEGFAIPTDQGSVHYEAEIAVLIASRRFSQLAGDSIDESLPENSWRVDLDPKGKLVWRAPQDSGLADSYSEPDASLGLRLMLQLLGPLAPDSLL